MLTCTCGQGKVIHRTDGPCYVDGCECRDFHKCHCDCHKKPDPIEEKVKDIVDLLYWIPSNTSIDAGMVAVRKKLLELVDLARKSND